MASVKFSDKQLDFILNSDAFINIADGAVRGGKTYACLTRFMEFVLTLESRYPTVILGKTERTIKRNVIIPLKEMFGSHRIHYIQGTGEVKIANKLIYVVGANDERSVDRIRGMTLAGGYCNELTLYPEMVFQTLIDRCTFAEAKIFGDTNPDSPFHWLNRNYLTNRELLEAGDLKRWRFGLDDNPILSDAYKNRLKRIHKGLWYRRMILGEWCQAEGAVYDMLDTDPKAGMVLNNVPEGVKIIRHWIGIDYGTTNACVFLLVGLGSDGVYYVLDEWRWDSKVSGRRKTDKEYSVDFCNWLENHRMTDTLKWIFVDPSAASFITQLYKDLPGYAKRRLSKAKNEVIDGIRLIASLLSSGKIKVISHNNNKHFIQEMVNYSWDGKAQEKGKDSPIKVNDHGPDALRYIFNGLNIKLNA